MTVNNVRCKNVTTETKMFSIGTGGSIHNDYVSMYLLPVLYGSFSEWNKLKLCALYITISKASLFRLQLETEVIIQHYI